MKRQYSNTSFSYNPSDLGAVRLWDNVKAFLVGKDTDYGNDYDGV